MGYDQLRVTLAAEVLSSLILSKSVLGAGVGDIDEAALIRQALTLADALLQAASKRE